MLFLVSNENPDKEPPMTASATTQTARPTHAITRPRIDSTVEILGVGDVLDIYDGSVFASL